MSINLAEICLKSLVNFFFLKVDKKFQDFYNYAINNNDFSNSYAKQIIHELNNNGVLEYHTNFHKGIFTTFKNGTETYIIEDFGKIYKYEFYIEKSEQIMRYISSAINYFDIVEKYNEIILILKISEQEIYIMTNKFEYQYSNGIIMVKILGYGNNFYEIDIKNYLIKLIIDHINNPDKDFLNFLIKNAKTGIQNQIEIEKDMEEIEKEIKQKENEIKDDIFVFEEIKKFLLKGGFI